MGITTAVEAEQWAQVLTASFVPLAVRSIPAGFTGSVGQRAVGTDLQISTVDCGPSEVVRTDRLARAAETGDLLFALHLDGVGEVEQHGRTVDLTPGTAVMYDTTRPYELRFPSHIQEIVLRVPRRALRLDATAVDDACARRLDADHPTLRVLQAFSRELLQVASELTPVQQQDLSRTAGDLIGSLLGGVGRTGGAREDALFARITRHIGDNLGDPGVTAQSLADRHHVSLRYLYLLFEEQGCTPAGYVRRERLRAAGRDLAARARRDTIAEVAHRYGFTDVTTFTRAFRRQFGVTPTQWRQRAVS